jgi:hypothetical protein
MPDNGNRWAGVSPDAEHHHHQLSAGATHTDGNEPIAVLRQGGPPQTRRLPTT